jgi:hypothetical protein
VSPIITASQPEMLGFSTCTDMRGSGLPFFDVLRLADRQSFGSGPKFLEAPVQSGEEPLVCSALSFM